MSQPKERRPLNRIAMSGIWLTLAVIIFWAGGEAFVRVQNYLPWALAASVLILILGLLIHFRKSAPPNSTSPQPRD